MRMFLNVVILLAGIAFGLLIRPRTIQAPGTLDPVSTTSAGPTLESIRSLASLVTTKVVVSDVQLTQLQGYTGGAKAALVVRGDFTLGTDLARARFTQVDTAAKSVVITLAQPTAGSPRVDLSRTRLVALGTEGLWDIVPGHLAEEVVADNAYRQAQQAVQRISREPQWQAQSMGQADAVLRAFFKSAGWTITVRWYGRAIP